MKISIIYRLKSFSKTVKFVWVGLCMAAVSSCDFLDVVPDNVSILDHAFSNSTEAEKFLFTCYAQLPQNGSENGNVGFFGADEAWLPKEGIKPIYQKAGCKGLQPAFLFTICKYRIL